MDQAVQLTRPQAPGMADARAGRLVMSRDRELRAVVASSTEYPPGLSRGRARSALASSTLAQRDTPYSTLVQQEAPRMHYTRN